MLVDFIFPFPSATWRELRVFTPLTAVFRHLGAGWVIFGGQSRLSSSDTDYSQEENGGQGRSYDCDGLDDHEGEGGFG